jgi:hypothetical protein
MVTGDEAAVDDLSFWLPLAEREPGCELLGEIALRSEIMRCNELSASSP